MLNDQMTELLEKQSRLCLPKKRIYTVIKVTEELLTENRDNKPKFYSEKFKQWFTLEFTTFKVNILDEIGLPAFEVYKNSYIVIDSEGDIKIMSHYAFNKTLIELDFDTEVE